MIRIPKVEKKWERTKTEAVLAFEEKSIEKCKEMQIDTCS